jgi:hypothetical protein
MTRYRRSEGAVLMTESIERARKEEPQERNRLFPMVVSGCDTVGREKHRETEFIFRRKL